MTKKFSFVFAYVLLLSTVSGFTECYRRVGKGNSLPSHIKTLAIPAFQNPSLRFKIEQKFTSAMIDEALRRGRSLNIVSTAEGADAVILGTIQSFSLRPVLASQEQGKFAGARLSEITVVVAITVRDQVKNKILFENQHLVFRGEYEISSDPASLFHEEGPAVDRMAKDFAKSVLSTILEGF